MLKALMLIAVLGHLLCGICDCLWMRQFSVTAAVIMLIAAVLFPLRIGGAGNWAGAVMFLGLLFLI